MLPILNVHVLCTTHIPKAKVTCANVSTSKTCTCPLQASVSLRSNRSSTTITWACTLHRRTITTSTCTRRWTAVYTIHCANTRSTIPLSTSTHNNQASPQHFILSMLTLKHRNRQKLRRRRTLHNKAPRARNEAFSLKSPPTSCEHGSSNT